MRRCAAAVLALSSTRSDGILAFASTVEGRARGMTTADTIMLEIDSARALAAQWASNPNRRQRSFWIGLALAAAVHAVAIIGIGSATPRSVGTEDGANNAINVELVDEKSLRDSMSSVTPP